MCCSLLALCSLSARSLLADQEFGSDSAPPIVLLHDIGDDRKSWDDVARRVAQGFRVLAIDMRGHGETTRSPRRLYGLDDILGDIHDLVVELSLNGRDWEGNVTRAWTICGRGTGAAVACAYAARHPGRCGALMLLDYDPQWRKDHLAFSLFQVRVHYKCTRPLSSSSSSSSRLHPTRLPYLPSLLPSLPSLPSLLPSLSSYPLTCH